MNDPTGQKEGLDVVRTLSENEGKRTVGSPENDETPQGLLIVFVDCPLEGATRAVEGRRRHAQLNSPSRSITLPMLFCVVSSHCLITSAAKRDPLLHRDSTAAAPSSSRLQLRLHHRSSSSSPIVLSSIAIQQPLHQAPRLHHRSSSSSPISPPISPDLSTNTGYIHCTSTPSTKHQRIQGMNLYKQSADVKKQTVFFLQTADVWSTSSAAEACRCGPQTADVLASKKQTPP
ncbi:hypothetical protein LXL04_014998 [Taraxacum kok-saghyz]